MRWYCGRMRTQQRGLWEVHVSVLLVGPTGLFAKFIHLPSIIIVFGRVFFASLALGFALLARKQSIRLSSGREYATLCILGLLLAIHWWAFFESIQIASVAIGVIMYSTFPIFVALMEPFFSRKRLLMRDVLLALATFGGVALAIPSYEYGSDVLNGSLIGLLSGASFAFLSILNRQYVQKVDSTVIAFYQDVIAAMILLPVALTFHGTVTMRDIALLVLLGTVFTALAHALFIQGMKQVEAKTASVIASLEAVYGIVFAAILLSEIPAVRTIIGGLIVLSTAMYVTLKQNSKQHTERFALHGG